MRWTPKTPESWCPRCGPEKTGGRRSLQKDMEETELIRVLSSGSRQYHQMRGWAREKISLEEDKWAVAMTLCGDTKQTVDIQTRTLRRRWALECGSYGNAEISWGWNGWDYHGCLSSLFLFLWNTPIWKTFLRDHFIVSLSRTEAVGSLLFWCLEESSTHTNVKDGCLPTSEFRARQSVHRFHTWY